MLVVVPHPTFRFQVFLMGNISWVLAHVLSLPCISTAPDSNHLVWKILSHEKQWCADTADTRYNRYRILFDFKNWNRYRYFKILKFFTDTYRMFKNVKNQTRFWYRIFYADTGYFCRYQIPLNILIFFFQIWLSKKKKNIIFNIKKFERKILKI